MKPRMHWYHSVLATIHPMLICSQGEQEQQQLELISSTTKYEHIPDWSPPDGTSQNYADLELATVGPLLLPLPPAPMRNPLSTWSSVSNYQFPLLSKLSLPLSPADVRRL